MDSEKHLKTKRAALIMVFLIGILLIILLLKQIGALKVVSTVMGALSAVIYGFFIACMISPIVNACERFFTKRLLKDGKPRKGLCRVISVIIGEVILVVAAVLVLLLVIPQLSISLNELVPSMSKLIAHLKGWLSGLSASEYWTDRIFPALSNGIDGIAAWAGGVFGEGSDLFRAISTGLMSVVSIVLNVFIGMILSIYLLIGKETLYAQVRKLSASIFHGGREKFIMEAIDKAGSIFSGYFAGKIIEAVIVGVICFFGMVLLNLPYATLISVIVGVTNIIPFFGGYIGPGIGTILLLLISPVSAIVFLVFAIILMQVDGNLIGPKVIGSHTGLPALWVVISILFFGGIWGFAGTLIGVPVFAWIYYVVKRLSEHALKKRGMPVETAAYMEDEDEEGDVSR